MKHRHHVHKKAKGGEVEQDYGGGESNVAKEAEEKKHGGSVHAKVKKHSMHHMHAEGGRTKHRLDKFRRGGRAKGGRTGSNNHPLTSAANVSYVGDHSGEEIHEKHGGRAHHHEEHHHRD